MNSRLPLLLGACFLTGLGGGILLIPKRTPEPSSATVIPESLPSPRAAETRSEPASPEARAELLHSLSLTADEWPDDTTEALVRQLLADPAFINAIWQDARPEDRSQVMVRTFAALEKRCPAYIWRVVERLDFDLPTGTTLLESLALALQAAPEDAHATLRQFPGHLPPELLRSVLYRGAMASCSFSGFLVTDSVEGVEVDPALLAAAAGTLFAARSPLPEGWENVEAFRTKIETYREEHASHQVALDWASQGFPLNLLDDPGAKVVESIPALVSAGKVPSPAVYDALVERGNLGALGSTLKQLGADTRIGEAVALLNGMQQKPSGPEWDALLKPIVHQANNQNPDRLQTLDFISHISDPQERAQATSELFIIWIDYDPEAARAALPRLGNEARQASLAERIEKTTTTPR